METNHMKPGYGGGADMARPMGESRERMPSEFIIRADARKKWLWLDEEVYGGHDYESVVSYWDDTMTWPEEFVTNNFGCKSDALDDSHRRLAEVVDAIQDIRNTLRSHIGEDD